MTMSMRAERISKLYDGLRAVDTLIAKAIRVDELAQTARIETKLREYIAVQWEDLAKQASRTATASLRKGKGLVTDAEITRLNKLIDRTMAQWSGRIADRYTEDLREVYELAHIAANKRALGRRKRGMEFNTRSWDTGEVEKAAPIPAAEIGANFDLVDLQNMDAFEDQQLFWIGQHYDENVSKHVHDTARSQIIEQGRGRVEAGKTMQKVVGTALNEVRIPGGFNGTAKKYFEGLVANSATVQRVTAEVNSFKRVGIKTYTVVNVLDHRTCVRCDAMNGKTFKISDADKLVTRLRNAKNPTDVKKIQPFMSVADSKLSNAALVERGNVISPFHYKCRCSIDISEEEELIPVL